MGYKQRVLFIQIKNPFVHSITTNDNGLILSSKRNLQSEGIGLQSIKSAIENEQGAVETSYEGNEFCLSIMLFDVGTNNDTSSIAN